MTQKKKLKLDMSKEFFVGIAVELPFWVSLESGRYTLPNERELNLRNDFWLLSVGNLVDTPPERIGFSILNEKQIEDQDLLAQLNRNDLQYHKRKMKTVFTRPLSIIPVEGAVTAKEGSEEWVGQIEGVLINCVPFKKHQELLLNPAAAP